MKWFLAALCAASLAVQPVFSEILETNSGFALIQGGTFVMGSPASEEGRRDNEEEHKVTVSGFYMGRHEVTVGEFRRFAEDSQYRTSAEARHNGKVYLESGTAVQEDADWAHPYMDQEDDHPVVLVSWYDAAHYCNWLSKQEGFRPAYIIKGTKVIWKQGARGYRLPTEAEWEYACRAGTAAAFHTGSRITKGQANFDGYATAPVGSYPPNPWGLYDMHGNVWEWCWDWYGRYSLKEEADPAGPETGEDRINRGGCYRGVSDGSALRSAYRWYGDPPEHSDNTLGFRVVRAAGR
ncbi:MAG: formylglycine-generating enzyme family protein [Spirochaetaceae bacterium]|jgi:formylglycine-generating enzyme required for sulfatase activity|nr:formylglycine-generating enzyme family protein [Spirochaetaceae bacterium]